MNVLPSSKNRHIWTEVLKNSTTYYYKVRTYAKQSGKYVYSAFTKANLSTKVTANYVAKRFSAVYKAVCHFFGENSLTYEKTYQLYSEEDLSRYGVEYLGDYISCKFESKAEAVKTLNRYLTENVAKNLVDDRFFYINGDLYLWVPVSGAEEYLVLDKTTTEIQDGTDWIKDVTIHSVWKIFEDEEWTEDYFMEMSFDNGRWVFGESRAWDSIFYPYGYSYYP